MDRAAFLLEDTGERIGCLLNPESVIVRRAAGIARRERSTGPLGGVMLSDDPLIFTGGGRTEVSMQLLFDVGLAGSSITTEDVRALTGPMWELAENATIEGQYGKPPLVRLIWGKAWNIPGVITHVAEQLEQFSSGGAPRRSWMTVRFLRVAEPDLRVRPIENPEALIPDPDTVAEISAGEEDVRIHEVRSSSPPDDPDPRGASERLDELAHRYFGDAGLWRFIAAINDVDDPMHLQAGRLLRIISQTAGRGTP
jgi:contractile injection system tube protein